MSFKSAEGSKFISDFSYVNYPTAQGSVEFPSGLTAGDVDISAGGIITAEEFKISNTVYLASTGVEAPLVDCNDLVAKNLIEVKNQFLFTADEGGFITFEDGTTQSTAYNKNSNVFSFNLVQGSPIASGDDAIIPINPSGFGGFTTGRLYFISVSIEATTDTNGAILTNYNGYLKYNGTVLCNNQVEGQTGDNVISIPMSGMFIGVSGVAPEVQLICNTSTGTWNYTNSSIYNIVRIS